MAKDLVIGALLDVYGSFLSRKQREIMAHYYNDDLSLAEIAENEGTTRQAVSDIIRRGEATLKKYESECGYYAKISAIKKICESDEKDSGKIAAISDIIDNF
ncbi:MAG: DNA-binding protein [Clostridia bacterium]|nr:DNA-binding protein [Clostridia bacterium]